MMGSLCAASRRLAAHFAPALRSLAVAGLLSFRLAAAASADTGAVTKASVNAGVIWNQADAARKCPAVATGYGGVWNGQWRTTEPKTTSVCEIAYVAASVETGFIANQAGADERCVAAAKANAGMWDGSWRTTSPGKTSVCDLRLPPSKPLDANWLIGTWHGEAIGTGDHAYRPSATFTSGAVKLDGRVTKATYDIHGGTIAVSYVDDSGNRQHDTFTRVDATHATGTYPDGKMHAYALSPYDVPPAPVAGVDFKNFDYAVSPCGGASSADDVPPPVLVRNGTFAYTNETMGTAFDVSVSFVQRGSLLPGRQQALVVLACHFPIGGTSTSYVYDVGGTTAVLLGTLPGADWGGDWGSGPSSIHSRFANRFLYVDVCKPPDCKQRVVTTYALRGGKFVRVWQQTH